MLTQSLTLFNRLDFGSKLNFLKNLVNMYHQNGPKIMTRCACLVGTLA